jgi:hypothetical protein
MLISLFGALAALGLWTGSRFTADPGSASVGQSVPAVETEEIHAAQNSVPSGEGIELASHEALAETEDPSGTEQEQPESPDERGRRQVIGDWEDDYQGHRRLTVRADGTATMRVEPSGIGRKLFANQLQFEIEWTVADGRIVMITTGGEPKAKTNLIMNLYGTRAEYKLLNLDDRQLLLLDADGKTKYEWRRITGDDPKN